MESNQIEPPLKLPSPICDNDNVYLSHHNFVENEKCGAKRFSEFGVREKN